MHRAAGSGSCPGGFIWKRNQLMVLHPIVVPIITTQMRLSRSRKPFKLLVSRDSKEEQYSMKCGQCRTYAKASGFASYSSLACIPLVMRLKLRFPSLVAAQQRRRRVGDA